MKQINQPGRFMACFFFAGLIFSAMNADAADLSARAQAGTLTVQSDHLDIWEKKQQAMFTGNVHLARGSFELFCDTLRAFYRSGEEGGGIDHALASGHVRMLQGDKKGTAASALIDIRRQLVTLRGHAAMAQPGGRVEGDTIVYNIAARTTEVRQGENGRVRLRIDEKQMDGSGEKTQPQDAGKPVVTITGKERP